MDSRFFHLSRTPRKSAGKGGIINYRLQTQVAAVRLRHLMAGYLSHKDRPEVPVDLHMGSGTHQDKRINKIERSTDGRADGRKQNQKTWQIVCDGRVFFKWIAREGSTKVLDGLRATGAQRFAHGLHATDA